MPSPSDLRTVHDIWKDCTKAYSKLGDYMYELDRLVNKKVKNGAR